MSVCATQSDVLVLPISIATINFQYKKMADSQKVAAVNHAGLLQHGAAAADISQTGVTGRSKGTVSPPRGCP